MSAAHSDPYWLGRFTMAVAMNLRVIEKRPKEAHENLRGLMREFLRTHPDPDLRKTLKEEMR